MAQTIAGIVDKPVDAQRLINELVRDCLCDRADISVIARDAALSSSEKASARTDELKGAFDTSAAGMQSLLDGLLAGLEAVSHSIPGGGTLRTIGKVGATLAHVSVASAAELAKALISFGVAAPDAPYYAEALQSGGVLVTVQAKTDKSAHCARSVMMKHGALAPEHGVT
jgi:hypothetical protein